MHCLLGCLGFLAPRFVIVLLVLLSDYMGMAYETLLWPLLGFLFLPWTTLMYALVFPGGVTGFDWVWMGLAFLADISSYAGGAYGNRDRIPGR